MSTPWRTISVALRADGSAYAATLGQASAQTKAFGNEVDRSTKSSASKWTTMSKGFAVGGALLAAGFVAAVSTTAKFEARLSAVQAVSNATAGEMDLLRDKALQLGADTAFSASESASAMEELVKAGLSVEDVLNGAADATVALAAAGGVELTTAAEIAANAMNVFALSAEDMPKIADLVAAAANASAIDVADFAMSLQQSGAVANLVGLDFEDLALAITAMGNAGIKGSDAGTSLKTFFMRLEPSTAKSTSMMERLGIITEETGNKFFDAAGNAKDMADISGVLADALAGQTREQKLATLNTLFGSDAIRAAAVIADEGAAGFDKLGTALGSISAAEIAEIRLDNLAGDMEKLSGSFETLLITSGSLFTDVLRSLVQGATSLVDALAEIDGDDIADFMEPAARYGRSLADSWDDLYDAGVNVAEILGDLIDAGKPVATVLAGLGAAAIVGGIRAVAGALELVTGFLADHSGAIIAAATAWAAYRGALIAASAWATLSAAVSGVTTSVTYLTGAIGSLAATQGVSNLTASVGVLRASFQAATAGAAGLALGIGAIAGAAAYGYTEWKKWGEEGRKLAESEILGNLRKDIDGTGESYFAAAAKAREGANMLRMETIGSSAPWDADWRESMRAGADELENFGAESIRAGAAVEVGMNGLIAATGMGRDELVAFANKAGIDLPAALASGEINIGEYAGEIIAATEANANGTPVTDSLAGAFATFADETSNATDKLKAYKTLVDSLLGVQLSVFDATTAYGGALDELDDTLRENMWGGIGTDTAAGRANRDALSGAVNDAMALAEAFAAAGDNDKAAYTIATTRAELIKAGQAAGIAEDDMNAYLDQLGLTPDTVETLVQALIDQGKLAEAEGALTALERDRYVTLKASVSGAAAGILEKFLPGFDFTPDGERANGGPVRAGRPYVVGERRPELFVPKSSGWILPSVPKGLDGGSTIDYAKLAQAMSGMAGPRVTVHAPVDARGTDVAGAATIVSRRIGWALADLG